MPIVLSTGVCPSAACSSGLSTGGRAGRLGRGLLSGMADRLERLYDIVDGYNDRFPEGDTPFAIVTRLLEEAGEGATVVNHLERAGAKVAKRGVPDPAELASELEDLIHTALSLARFYGVEAAV